MNEVNNISGTIVGKVHDEKGRGLGGVKVRCGDMETRTLFDGSYRFESLNPGIQTLVVDVEGYRGRCINVQVREAEVAQVDFRLDPKIGTAKIWGYVLDSETKKPINEGGRIYMLRIADNKNVAIDPKTGYYEFRGLPSGAYKIWASILNYREEEKTVEVKEAEERREDFLCGKVKDSEPLWG